jgi:hypothetical protein
MARTDISLTGSRFAALSLGTEASGSVTSFAAPIIIDLASEATITFTAGDSAAGEVIEKTLANGNIIEFPKNVKRFDGLSSSLTEKSGGSEGDTIQITTHQNSIEFANSIAAMRGKPVIVCVAGGFKVGASGIERDQNAWLCGTVGEITVNRGAETNPLQITITGKAFAGTPTVPAVSFTGSDAGETAYNPAEPTWGALSSGKIAITGVGV